MSNTAQHKGSTTQKFIEIVDIVDTVVILSENYACLVIEVSAINFSLLSREEQDARLISYASLLNSLSFPIQILVRNKRVDISSYIKLIEQEKQSTKNAQLSSYIDNYLQFVQKLVTVNTILDKKFYIAVSFSSLELGPYQAFKKEDFVNQAQAALQTKAESLHNQLSRMNLASKTLSQDELTKLFHDMYNPNAGSIETSEIKTNIQSAFVKKVPKEGVKNI